MTIWKPINACQLERLFEENACLFGDTDGIPIDLAVEIFGKAAIDFTVRLDEPGWRATSRKLFGIGEFQAEYITLHGAKIAASYCNAVCMERRVRAAAVKNAPGVVCQLPAERKQRGRKGAKKG